METISGLMPPTAAHEAVYVAQRVVLSPSIVDIRLLLASPKAADFFGYPGADQLTGAYLSQLYHPADLACRQSWAALHPLETDSLPPEYLMRIQRQDGAQLTVQQRDSQLHIGATQIWVVQLAPLDTATSLQLLQPPPEPVGPEAWRAMWGTATLQSATDILDQVEGLTDSDRMDTVIHSISTTKKQALMSTQAIEQLQLNSDRLYYKYRCLVCSREWIGYGRVPTGRPRHPKRCTNPDCRSTVWYDPVLAAAARVRKQAS